MNDTVSSFFTNVALTCRKPQEVGNEVLILKHTVNWQVVKAKRRAIVNKHILKFQKMKTTGNNNTALKVAVAEDFDALFAANEVLSDEQAMVIVGGKNGDKVVNKRVCINVCNPKE